jgi:hypothetical protein
MNLELLSPPSPILPVEVWHADVLRFFGWYITVAFVTSLLMRWRLYTAFYRIAVFFAKECPNVFLLLHRHWPALIKNGVTPLLAAYGVILAVFMVCTRLIFPGTSLSLTEIESTPLLLVMTIAGLGAMVAIDSWLIFTVGNVDAQFAQAELRYAEAWLGGRINKALDFLGEWNPIRRYADYQTRMVVQEFNSLFRYNLKVMTFQVFVRSAIVGLLFSMAAFKGTHPTG